MPDAPDASTPTAKKRRGVIRRREFEALAQAKREELRAQVAVTRAHIDATNEKIEARTGRNLPLAILFGLVLGVCMLLSLVLVKSLFMVVAAGLMIFTALELASALRFSGRAIPRIPTVITAVAVVPAAFYLQDAGKWLVFIASLAFVAAWRALEQLSPARRTNAAELWRDLGAGTLIQAYVPFLGGFAVLLTAHPGGEWWTLAFLLLVIATDTGAYASGLLFGKHPMAPRISPKKTWEGFAGSALVALVGGAILAVFMLKQDVWVGLIFGATILVTATVGDLTESLIKRDLGIKDISTWLPGHGGFLDRLDSVLPSAVAAYALYLIFA